MLAVLSEPNVLLGASSAFTQMSAMAQRRPESNIERTSAYADFFARADSPPLSTFSPFLHAAESDIFTLCSILIRALPLNKNRSPRARPLKLMKVTKGNGIPAFPVGLCYLCGGAKGALRHSQMCACPPAVTSAPCALRRAVHQETRHKSASARRS
jgi:hypothetical protein